MLKPVTLSNANTLPQRRRQGGAVGVRLSALEAVPAVTPRSGGHAPTGYGNMHVAGRTHGRNIW